jgi:hypothetical protein
LRMRSETVWHSDNKERVVEFSAMRHGVQHVTAAVCVSCCKSVSRSVSTMPGQTMKSVNLVCTVQAVSGCLSLQNVGVSQHNIGKLAEFVLLAVFVVTVRGSKPAGRTQLDVSSYPIFFCLSNFHSGKWKVRIGRLWCSCTELL